jgi:hypothetical protein
VAEKSRQVNSALIMIVDRFFIEYDLGGIKI